MKVLFSLFFFTLCIGIARLQTAEQERKKYNPSDFVYDLFKSKPTSTGVAGTGQRVGLEDLPPLKGLGVSSVIFHIEPCGINLPHVHPRGTELFHVLEGSFQTAFAEENGGRVIVNNLTVGQVTIFPQGLVHMEQNLGCTNATFLSAFSSEDPGVLQIVNRLFDFPQQSLTSTFNQGDAVINAIRNNLGTNPARGRGECLIRCGLMRGK